MFSTQSQIICWNRIVGYCLSLTMRNAQFLINNVATSLARPFFRPILHCIFINRQYIGVLCALCVQTKKICVVIFHCFDFAVLSVFLKIFASAASIYKSDEHMLIKLVNPITIYYDVFVRILSYMLVSRWYAVEFLFQSIFGGRNGQQLE